VNTVLKEQPSHLWYIKVWEDFLSEIIIHGGKRLNGRFRVQGSKNGVLPIMAGTLLCEGVTILENVPRITDVTDMCAILETLGCVCVWEDGHTLRIDTTCACPRNIEANLTERMRSSIFLLGPLLARFGEANLHLPGGCSIGKRPIDLHLAGLRSLGAVIHEREDGISALCLELRGNAIHLRYPSVGATENILMAAVAAKGYTRITGCAREPEIVELCLFLNACGARISGIGSSSLQIQGRDVRELQAVRFCIGGDRIAAATYLYGAAGCGGHVCVEGIAPVYLRNVLTHLAAMGCICLEHDTSVELYASGKPMPADVVTGPYPAYPTDLQSIAMAVLGRARGISVVTERVFEKRFGVAGELEKFGVRLKVQDQSAMIYGSDMLHGTTAHATDLRGGAALMVAGLMAEGETHILDVAHIDRGYEAPEQVLCGLGAEIKRRA
jgi:UDP-N-acetylglucosamine 1-carboxyvinyltransferase